MLRETFAARITSRSTPALHASPVTENNANITIATRARLIGLSPLRRFQDKTRPRSRERGSRKPTAIGARDAPSGRPCHTAPDLPTSFLDVAAEDPHCGIGTP